MPYKHGIYAQLAASRKVEPDQSQRAFTYVGTAPINLATEPKVNQFVKLETVEDAQKYVGYTDDYKNYTLNEVIGATLDNPVSPVGPIYVYNVLDPEKHIADATAETKKLVPVSFYRNVGYIDDPMADINSIVVEDRKPNEHYTVRVVDGKIQLHLLPESYKAGNLLDVKQEVKVRPQADDTNWPELYAAAGITFKDGYVDFKPDKEWTHDKKLEIDVPGYKVLVLGLQFPKPDPEVKKVIVDIPGAQAEGNTGAEYDLSQEGVTYGDGVENGELVLSFSVGFYEDKTHAYYMEQELDFTWIKENGEEIKTSYNVVFNPEDSLPNGNGTLNAWYSQVDPAKVTIEDIIGEKNEDTGVRTGLYAVENLEEKCGVIPTDLGVPGFSKNPEVFKVMQSLNPIGGHWHVFTYADLDVDEVKTIDQAIAKLEENDMRSETAAVFWPMEIDINGKIRHASTGYMAAQLAVDIDNDSIPYEAASNKDCHLAGKYFGEDPVLQTFNQDTANRLNAAGINTIAYHNGRQVYWGTHTSAYNYEDGDAVDPRSVDLSVMRMMLFLVNGFQQRYGDRIDRPMSRAIKDEILIEEKQYLDWLEAVGALLGNPTIEFVESKNPISEILQGRFVYDIDVTPATPLRYIACDVHYTDEGVYRAFTTEE